MFHFFVVILHEVSRGTTESRQKKKQDNHEKDYYVIISSIGAYCMQ